MKEILVTGSEGQLGQELCFLLDEYDIEYKATTSQTLDITDNKNVEIYFLKNKPEYIFHCAAYTAVDLAEDERKELNWEVNAKGTENIAKAAKQIGATLIYISTDYVFDGITLNEYDVDDLTNPKNEYGKAKLAGEEAVKNYCEKHYIIRTSWVFGKYGKNFVYTMLNLAENMDRLTVVSDQYGRPTWTRTLAEFILHLYNSKPEYGIYHLSNEGSCSWYEFACEILKDKEVKIIPITSDEYPQEAYRPKYSKMNLSKTIESGFRIPTWKVALNLFKEELNA